MKRRKYMKQLFAFIMAICLLTACASGGNPAVSPDAEHNPNADLGMIDSGTENQNGNPDGADSQGAGKSDGNGSLNADGTNEAGKSTGNDSSNADGTNGAGKSDGDGSSNADGTDGTGKSDGEDDGSKYVIVLDPGHGARFTGAVYDGKEEKRLNLKIAAYAKAYLEDKYDCFTVYMTREDDRILSDDQVEDLTLRAEMAKELKADALVSLHLNASSNHKQDGAAVYCPHRANVKEASFSLAECILTELEALGLKNNGPLTRNSNDTFDEEGKPVEYYAINRHAADRDMIGIIVEHCFMDSKTDAVFIQDEEALRALGEADARGIAAYFGY